MTEDKNRFWRMVGDLFEGLDILDLGEVLFELIGCILQFIFEVILEMLGSL